MTGYESKRAMAQDKLAQPAQEPVALPDLPLTPYRRIDDAPLWDKHHLHSYALRYADLLTTPPAAQPQRTWVGLTDEERKEIALEVPMDAVCITEAKLKEKNNG
jgi:hypothetical protein